MLFQTCGTCDAYASNRCLECNDILCEDCVLRHQNQPHSYDHYVVPINNLSPIGSSASISNGSPHNTEPQCDNHCEALRYIILNIQETHQQIELFLIIF